LRIGTLTLRKEIAMPKVFAVLNSSGVSLLLQQIAVPPLLGGDYSLKEWLIEVDPILAGELVPVNERVRAAMPSGVVPDTAVARLLVQW